MKSNEATHHLSLFYNLLTTLLYVCNKDIYVLKSEALDNKVTAHIISKLEKICDVVAFP